MVFSATVFFSYIVVVSFIGEGNRRKPPTRRKSLTNFITYNVVAGFKLTMLANYPLANEVTKGYSNATVLPSALRNILVNTLESTSFNGF
jgi:hypothetical protein